jgi:hypothetical protein
MRSGLNVAWNVGEQVALVDMVINLRALQERCNSLTRSTTGFIKEVCDPLSLILLTRSLFVESTFQTLLFDSVNKDETEILTIARMKKLEMCTKFW